MFYYEIMYSFYTILNISLKSNCNLGSGYLPFFNTLFPVIYSKPACMRLHIAVADYS